MATAYEVMVHFMLTKTVITLKDGSTEFWVKTTSK